MGSFWCNLGVIFVRFFKKRGCFKNSCFQKSSNEHYPQIEGTPGSSNETERKSTAQGVPKNAQNKGKDAKSGKTKTATTRKKIRTTLFKDFCNEFGFKIASTSDGQPTHETTAGSSSNIDHMAYGWIANGGCKEHNGSLEDIKVTVKPDSLSHASKEKHHLCVAEVDLTKLGPPEQPQQGQPSP